MTAPALRLVPPLAAGPADAALRPQSFDDFIGQREIVKNLRASVASAKRAGRALDHFLFAGPPGLGKTSLASVIAAELGMRLRVVSGPAIGHRGELASLLTSLEARDVLFIDEMHRLAPAVQEMLYTVMEDFRLDLFTDQKKAISIPLPRFTLLGATTHAGMLAQPLLDRFGFVWQLRPYDLSEMTEIVKRSAIAMGIVLDDYLGAAEAIARASRGTPRLVNRLLRRAVDFAESVEIGRLEDGRRYIDGVVARAALHQLGVDTVGLGDLERRYLALVADRPVGIAAICAQLGESRQTIEDVVEPFLLQLGLITRAPRGRAATEAGRTHLAEQQTCLEESHS